MKITRYLIVTADGDARVVTRKPRLSLDEVAFRLNINVPDGWGKAVGTLEVQMPEPPEALIDHDDMLLPEVAGDPEEEA